MSERYVAPGPVDLVGFLCLSSANGVQPMEGLPGLLAQFLSKRGIERIAPAGGLLLDQGDFRREGDRLIIGGGEGFDLALPLDPLQEDPPVEVREVEGEWQPLAGQLSHFLLAGIDQRIRACHVPRGIQPFAKRDQYTSCPNLEPRELLPELKGPSPEWVAEIEAEGGTWSGWGTLTLQNETYFYDKRGKLQLPEGLEDFLRENLLDIQDSPRALAVDLHTMTLYSAWFGEDGGFESLVQVRPQLSARIPYRATEDFPLICQSVDETMDLLAHKVHDRALAYGLSLVPALPERVRPLGVKELRYYSYRAIQLFLERFVEKGPFQLGRKIEGRFLPASGLRNEGELSVLWSIHPQNASPFPWKPTLPRAEKEEPAPAALEPFLKETIYRTRDYILLNRYTFLARKMVTQAEFCRLTEDYTDQERLALLTLERELLDAVLECIFTCVQEGELTITVNGKDLLTLCPDPLTHLPAWTRHYRRTSLDFLEEGKWKKE